MPHQDARERINRRGNTRTFVSAKGQQIFNFMRIGSDMSLFIQRQTMTYWFPGFFGVQNFTKRNGAGRHIDDHRMAVFNGEAEGDWVSPRKRSAPPYGATQVSVCVMAIATIPRLVACSMNHERAAVGRIFDADETQPRLSRQTNSVICRLYQRAVSHSIIRVQNSD